MTTPALRPKHANPSVTVRFDLPPSAEALQVLDALRQAVAQALDRKRRLGQYAVVWEDGRVQLLRGDALPALPAGADATEAAPAAYTPVTVTAQEPTLVERAAPQNVLPREPDGG